MSGPMLGTKPLRFIGNPAMPSSVIVSSSGSSAIAISGGAKAEITGIRAFVDGTWGNVLDIKNSASVGISHIEFGNSPRHQIEISQSGLLEIQGSYSILGDAIAHILISGNSAINGVNFTVTTTNDPTFSAFLIADTGAVARFWNPTFNGSATGKRFSITTNAAVNLFGIGIEAMPGSLPGETQSGGTYA